MKGFWLLIAGLLILPAIALAQPNDIKLKGTAVDAANRNSIPFASLGLKGADFGTVSNSNGEFELSVAEKHASDTVIISMVGYVPLRYTVKELSQLLEINSQITMVAATYTLNEVEVTSKKLKAVTLGNEATPAGVGMTPFKFSNLGNEIGLLCKVKGKTTYLEAFNVDIFLNDYDTLFFRLNIYTLDNGLPKDNILHAPVYLKFTGKKGKASINLQPYNIMVNEDFVVSLEYVKRLRKVDLTRKEQSGLYFGAKKAFGGTVFTRSASQADWNISSSGLFAPKMAVEVKSL
ncbi:carboxypeptidase-like regulatory domain-containing protein [Pontibacter sp. MBLB2868]|uniref:carboxypeptidase-like regulatory domain-containing protein n=1 Tax=Pontibacter sp. MBLB2868 TaxID=3451555 RepID=UPI003F74E1D1